MNRRLTGLLAWSALALVIAVPSAEVLLTQSEDKAEVAGLYNVPQSPMPKQSSIADASALPFQPEPAAPAAKVPTDPRALPLPPIVALRGLKPKQETPAAVEVVEPPQPTADVMVADVVDAYEPIPLEFRTGADQATDVAAIAPVPMPVIDRPVTRVAKATPSRNVVTVSSARRELPRLNGPALDDGLDDDAPFWGDDPRYRGRVRLDQFEETNSPVMADDASDSAFYEIWRAGERPVGFQRNGSFEEQLPARRGNSVRLDLLQ